MSIFLQIFTTDNGKKMFWYSNGKLQIIMYTMLIVSTCLGNDFSHKSCACNVTRIENKVKYCYNKMLFTKYRHWLIKSHLINVLFSSSSMSKIRGQTVEKISLSTTNSSHSSLLVTVADLGTSFNKAISYMRQHLNTNLSYCFQL